MWVCTFCASDWVSMECGYVFVCVSVYEHVDRLCKYLEAHALTYSRLPTHILKLENARAMYENSGADTGELVDIFQGLADINVALGQELKAVDIQKRILDLARRVYGKDHAVTGDAAAHLGELLYFQQDFEPSVLAYNEARRIYRDRFDENHPKVLMIAKFMRKVRKEEIKARLKSGSSRASLALPLLSPKSPSSNSPMGESPSLRLANEPSSPCGMMGSHFSRSRRVSFTKGIYSRSSIAYIPME